MCRCRVGRADSDHMSNIDQSVAGTAGVDDETIEFVNVGIDITVKAPFLPAVSYKVTELPISTSPGLASGHHKFVGLDSEES